MREKVYERMIAERKRIAEKSRSEGQGRKAEIDGEREKEFQRFDSGLHGKWQGEDDRGAGAFPAGGRSPAARSVHSVS